MSPIDPAPEERPLTVEQSSSLAEAKRLMDKDDPAAAAPLYAHLAKQMEFSNQPQRAANMHALAAQAFTGALDRTAALIHARMALELFIGHKMNQRAPFFYNSILKELNKQGLASVAQTLQDEFGRKIALLPGPTEPAAHEPHKDVEPQLPTNCPNCGAPLHPERLTWVNQRTAECEYCGSLIRPGK